MTRYVNHQAMSEVFAVPEAEADPVIRANLLASIQHEFIERLLGLYEQTAYELKKRGDNIGQIGELIGFSDRRIRHMLSDYSKRTGAWNPLKRRSSDGAIDITHLVLREHQEGARKASPPNRAPEP